jgi:hypothetical protein
MSILMRFFNHCLRKQAAQAQLESRKRLYDEIYAQIVVRKEPSIC